MLIAIHRPDNYGPAVADNEVLLRNVGQHERIPVCGSRRDGL
jgi:hypothetical protein